MRRRRFVGTLTGAAAAAAALFYQGLAGCSSFPAERRFRGWTWVHGGRERSADGWRREFARLRAGGISGVLVSGGDADILAHAAHREGLEFHRWIWTLNRSGDAWVKAHHPEWFTVSRSGDSTLDRPPYVGYYQWLCPTREPVREYLRDKVAEIAQENGVDGVHLDYVRHSDVILPIGLWPKYDLIQDREYPEFDFCYCEVCRAVFAAQTGKDPLELPDPTLDAEWRAFRWESVTGLVRVLADVAHAHDVQISAAVFPTPSLARQLVRQAWDQWPLDSVFPMLYHTFYNEEVEWIGTATREGIEALPGRTPLFSGLYLPSLPPEALGRAVQVAREAGAAGVSLFEMDGLSERHLAELAAALRP